MIPEVTRDRAVQVFAKRFENSGLSNEEIGQRFDDLLRTGFLDFDYGGPDGELRVRLCGQRRRQ